MNIAVILAGGLGTRLEYSTPKQFFKVAGKSVIEHTIDVFENNQKIDEIAIVIHESLVLEIENLILNNSWKKVKKVLNGGKERYESSLVAINSYSSQPDSNIIFHDAVRPLVSNRIINDVIIALGKYNAVDVALPATDTIIQVDKTGKFIENIPNRNYLRRGQTPQGFKLDIIKKAYDIGLNDENFRSSDDCGIVVKYLPKEKVYVVLGEESNLKLTYKEDTYLLEKLFQLRSSSLTEELDFNLLNQKVIVIFGGNSGIGKQIVNISNKYNAKVFSFSRATTSTDISNIESVKEALEKVYKITKRIDFVVNAAAILNKEPLVSMKYDTIQQMIRTNYDGNIHVALESFKYLKETRGQLLLYTSSSYTRGRKFYSIYSSTKAAVVNFMQALSQEWEVNKIRVNVINPERTKTPMREKNFGNEPNDTLLTAKEVAKASILTLLSNFTGQVIDVKIKKTEKSNQSND